MPIRSISNRSRSPGYSALAAVSALPSARSRPRPHRTVTASPGRGRISRLLVETSPSLPERMHISHRAISLQIKTQTSQQKKPSSTARAISTARASHRRVKQQGLPSASATDSSISDSRSMHRSAAWVRYRTTDSKRPTHYRQDVSSARNSARERILSKVRPSPLTSASGRANPTAAWRIQQPNMREAVLLQVEIQTSPQENVTLQSKAVPSREITSPSVPRGMCA